MGIIVHKNLTFTKIDLEDYCEDHDSEECAFKLVSSFSDICTTLYRAPSGNFSHFLSRLESILSVLHSPEI